MNPRNRAPGWVPFRIQGAGVEIQILGGIWFKIESGRPGRGLPRRVAEKQALVVEDDHGRARLVVGQAEAAGAVDANGPRDDDGARL